MWRRNGHEEMNRSIAGPLDVSLTALQRRRIRRICGGHARRAPLIIDRSTHLERRRPFRASRCTAGTETDGIAGDQRRRVGTAAGNPAISGSCAKGPEALRPRLATGLPMNDTAS